MAGRCKEATARRVLLVDAFDSFAHNVAEGLRQGGAALTLRRADRCTPEEAEALAPELLVLGPGPGAPEEASLYHALLARFAGRIPILGICLGHQAVAVFFGGRVGRASAPVHGEAWPVFHDGRGLFRDLPSPFPAGRYHSLAVTALPDCLEATAHTADGTLMALRHRELPIAGLQFHPDSFLTPSGPEFFRHALHGAF